ncbi:MAG: DUF433 domain-containing protein [Bacteroidota bacterium]|nr:DUF433 domain-containing protein [Bacteroidota bacterium]
MSFQFIYFNEKILGGKAIIKDSRISVEFMMEWIASGGTVESFYQEYSYLPKRSVEEAIFYAAQFAKKDILI